MAKNKDTIINVVCSVMVLFTNIIISFFLSPYIVEHIGVEANGFVTLANNFVTYAQLLVTALNSMAARFISIAYVRGDYKKANMYYNSVFWGNLLIVAVLIVPAMFLVIRLEEIINVPRSIVWDVKLLFFFIFFGFFLQTGLPNWECGTFIANRLYRAYLPNLFNSVLRCIVLFIMLTFLEPRVWYVGFAAAVMTVSNLMAAGYNTHVLTPELRVFLKKGKRLYSGAAVKELVGSGIWNSITFVGNMLLLGLDLIICNLYIGVTEMGVVSLSKILPTLVQQLVSAIRGGFTPELTIDYAHGKKETILKNVNRSIKLTAFVVIIPITGIVILGDQFFDLWVPSQDAKQLQILSVLAMFGYMLTAGVQALSNVFIVTNNVRASAFSLIISGIVSVTVTCGLIRYTDLGIYAVAGVSTFVVLIRDLTFTLPAAAKYLGYKWYQFFPQVGLTGLSSLTIVLVGALVKHILPSGSWIAFLSSAFVVGCIGVLINYYIILSKEERIFLIQKLKRTR